jgi:zinc transporter ZupT
MFAALYLSGGDDKEGFWPAVSCGLASLAGCAIPCMPFIFSKGVIAFIFAGILTIVVGAVICKLRPETGFWSVAITYGVLIGAGLLAYVGSFT